MEQLRIREAIDRITRMERCFDALQAAAQHPAAIREDAALRALLRQLTQYYENGQWLHDYTLDEKGLLPQNLKRGILSQDAVYLFLEQIKENA